MQDKKSDISKFAEKSAHLRQRVCSLTTWMRSPLILPSINRLLTRENNRTLKRHKSKIDLLLSLQNTVYGIQSDPNETILNLSGHELSAEQIEILKLGLCYGLATRLNSLEMMTVTEDVWDQLDRLHQFNYSNFVKEKVKNSLRSFTYNFIDLDLSQFNLDRR